MCWWVKTKSAPLPERPCEQLTCCEKNGSVQGNYINRVTKRHNCRITGKTKATRYGGPSTQATRYPQRMSIANNATFAAGGQILSCSVITETTALSRLGYAQLFFNSISQARRNISPSLLPQRFFFSKHDFKIKAATIRTIAQSAQFLSFGIFYSYGCRRDSSHHGADSNYSDSLALRRWRRLISPSNAAVTNCPVLSPSSLTLSMASTIWSGTRASILFDFAFTDFVAISDFRLVWCPTMIARKKFNAMLDVSHTDKITCVRHLIFISHKMTKPRTVGAVTGLLTTNDSESIEVAMRNYTTHPQGRDSHNLNKYIWRFIALSTAQPRVITIEATSEQEARQQSPAGCVMVFAARIRQGVSHVQ
ncbi:host cell division inhibitor Icd-like protein [Escherichia coli]|nr:host cell division inhibitor Icd-like protein [Escherichia coli]